ncbi:GcrA family cell cycle regulator [Streptomyces sp. NPDC001089]
MARTFSDEDEDRLRQLHADGVSRNEIARQMGWSAGAITNHAQRLGLAFDREDVRVAVEARQVELKDRRQRIQEQLLDLAERTIDRARSEYTLTGVKQDGEFVHEVLREPPAKETKDLTLAASSALTSALKLAQVDAGDEGRESARGLLQSLSDAMASAARELGGDDADEYGS